MKKFFCRWRYSSLPRAHLKRRRRGLPVSLIRKQTKLARPNQGLYSAIAQIARRWSFSRLAASPWAHQPRKNPGPRVTVAVCTQLLMKLRNIRSQSKKSNELLMMNSFWNPIGLVLAATVVVVAGTSTSTQGQAQNQPPAPAPSRADEMLQAWNQIGNKLIAMAQDSPEAKYDFKVQKDERTFALNLLHAAALDFVLIRRVSGSNLGPDFGEGDNPSRDRFKTKAEVVKFVQEAVADGAKVIQQQGDAGLDKTSKFFGNRLAHNSSIWTFAIEHSGEHYGQLVVYYRANNLVPPDSRR